MRSSPDSKINKLKQKKNYLIINYHILYDSVFLKLAFVFSHVMHST